jgi:hypothetical protein
VLGNHAFPQVRRHIRGLAGTLNGGTQVKAYLWKRRDQQQPPVLVKTPSQRPDKKRETPPGNGLLAT